MLISAAAPAASLVFAIPNHKEAVCVRDQDRLGFHPIPPAGLGPACSGRPAPYLVKICHSLTPITLHSESRWNL